MILYRKSNFLYIKAKFCTQSNNIVYKIKSIFKKSVFTKINLSSSVRFFKVCSVFNI